MASNSQQPNSSSSNQAPPNGASSPTEWQQQGYLSYSTPDAAYTSSPYPTAGDPQVIQNGGHEFVPLPAEDQVRNYDRQIEAWKAEARERLTTIYLRIRSNARDPQYVAKIEAYLQAVGSHPAVLVNLKNNLREYPFPEDDVKGYREIVQFQAMLGRRRAIDLFEFLLPWNYTLRCDEDHPDGRRRVYVRGPGGVEEEWGVFPEGV